MPSSPAFPPGLPRPVRRAALAVRRAGEAGLSSYQYAEKTRLSKCQALANLAAAVGWGVAVAHGDNRWRRYYPPGTPCPLDKKSRAVRGLEAVRAAGPGGTTPTEIANKLGVQRTTVCIWLAAAVKAGTVSRRGRTVTARWYVAGEAPGGFVADILKKVQQAGEEGLSAYDSPHAFGVSYNTARKYLEELREVGLLRTIPARGGRIGSVRYVAAK